MQRVPDAPNRSFVEGRLDFLRSQPEPSTEAPTAREPEPVADSPPEAVGGSSDVPAIASLSVGGVLVATGIGSLVWWLDRSDVVSQCEDRGCANASTISSERDAALGVTIAASVLGLGAVALGTVLLLLGDDEEDTSATSLLCAPGLFSIACAGRL